jgi:hypothetical protein
MELRQAPRSVRRLFFVVAQILSWIVFKQVPSAMVLLGGTLIVAGGNRIYCPDLASRHSKLVTRAQNPIY